MSRGHSHGHGHGHSHGHGGHRGRLAIALVITTTILAAEVVGAVLTRSLALLVDAAHMLTDALGLLVALVAATLMRRPASSRRTWGWVRAEVLAAGVQAMILLAVGGYAVVDGVRRLVDPPEIAAGGLAVFGAVGLAGNLVAIGVLTGSRADNLNMRAAFLEVVNDALGSVAVLVAALVIATTGWIRADAVAGLLIAALILPRAWIILRQAGGILLESTPPGLDLDDVRRHILEVPHVIGVHDLHASLMGTGLPVLTAHVVLADDCFTDGHALQILDHLQECVASHFDLSVEHSTFQLESAGHGEHESARYH